MHFRIDAPYPLNQGEEMYMKADLTHCVACINLALLTCNSTGHLVLNKSIHYRPLALSRQRRGTPWIGLRSHGYVSRKVRL